VQRRGSTRSTWTLLVPIENAMSVILMLGVALVVASVVLLVWAFPKV
jgi:hypothetical protein